MQGKLINWIQVKLCFLKDSWLWYFHLCSSCVTVRCQKSIWHQRWGGQFFLASLNAFFISSSFNSQCLKLILPVLGFSKRKDECECSFSQLSVQHSVIPPVSSFHSSFSSTCFGFMRGQSVSSVMSNLGSRWRLPGSLYSTLVGYAGSHMSANKPPRNTFTNVPT